MTKHKNYDSPFDKENFEIYDNNTELEDNESDRFEYINYDDQDYFENKTIDRSLSNLPTRYLMAMTSLDLDNRKNYGYKKFKEDEGLK